MADRDIGGPYMDSHSASLEHPVPLLLGMDSHSASLEHPVPLLLGKGTSLPLG